MKIIQLPTMFAATLLVATAAFSAGMSASGVVKSVDTRNDSITLVDGSAYTLGEGFEAETFKPGQKVTIVFQKKKGKMVASSVKVVK
jgi:Cu/Ag efflux protein CusF